MRQFVVGPFHDLLEDGIASGFGCGADNAHWEYVSFADRGLSQPPELP